jgi:hypothetical protein
MANLADKIALVTDASRGMGRAARNGRTRVKGCVARCPQLFTRSNDGFGSRALFCGRDQRSQLTHIRNLSAQISKEFEEEFLLAASLILRGNVAPDPAIRDTERIMAASRMPAPLR